MTTCAWNGNGASVAQVVNLNVGAVAAGATLTATINGKSVTYTCVAGDTITTAAAAWQALLAAAAAVIPEFGEVVFTVSPTNSNILVATAATPGVPIADVTGGLSSGLTSQAAGGAALLQTTVQPNVSPSDVSNPGNWNRNGVAQLPQNGDDVVLADTSVPLLYGLDKLQAVQFATLTRWQSFEGTVGLPEKNPSGYVEWRPTYWQFSGGVAASSGSPGPASPSPSPAKVTVLLGQGQSGTGPSRERYNVGSAQATFVVRNSGSPADDFAVRLLGTNLLNALTVVNTSVAVAMLPGEAVALASASVDGGGTLALGPGCTCGPLTVTASSAEVVCAPSSVVVQNGSTLIVEARGLTFPSILAQNASTVTWLSDAPVTGLTLKTGSVFDKSQDLRPITIGAAAVDVDTCQVLDPFSAITWGAAITANNACQSGPFQFGAGRTVRIV